MAQTSTHFSQDTITFTLDDTQATPAQPSVSGSLVEATLTSEVVSVGETYTMDGDNPITGVAGLKYTLTADIVASTADDEFFDIVFDWNATKFGETKTGQINYPNSTDTPNYQWAGEWRLSSFEMSSSAAEGEVQRASVTLISSGTITATKNP